MRWPTNRTRFRMDDTPRESIAFWIALIACLLYGIIAGIVTVSAGPNKMVKVILPFILGAQIILSSLASERIMIRKIARDLPLLRGGNNKTGKILLGLILIFVSLYWLTEAFVYY